MAQQPPIPVTTVSPVSGQSTDTLTLSGTLIAAQQANLSPRVAGLVTQMNVDVGAEIKQGDVLLELDQQQEQATLSRLKAQLDAAQATRNEANRLVEEAQRLNASRHIAQTELALRKAALANTTAQLKAAEAEYQSQKIRLDWHQLTAPFDGIISEKYTESGEWVSPGEPVLQLVATDRVYLDVQVPQEKFSQLQGVTDATVVPDTQTQAIKGHIQTIVPVSNQASRTFRVRLTLSNPQQRLIPGTSATVRFSLNGDTKNILSIPRDALLRSPDGQYSVYVIDSLDGKPIARRQPVSIAPQRNRIGDPVAITQGLKDSDQVVIRGNEILHDKQAVQPSQTTPDDTSTTQP